MLLHHVTSLSYSVPATLVLVHLYLLRVFPSDLTCASFPSKQIKLQIGLPYREITLYRTLTDVGTVHGAPRMHAPCTTVAHHTAASQDHA